MERECTKRKGDDSVEFERWRSRRTLFSYSTLNVVHIQVRCFRTEQNKGEEYVCYYRVTYSYLINIVFPLTGVYFSGKWWSNDKSNRDYLRFDLSVLRCAISSKSNLFLEISENSKSSDSK